MVALEVDLAEVVLIEEIVGHDQPLVVVGQVDRVRAGVEPEVHHRHLAKAVAVGDVQHAHLSRLERAEDHPLPVPGHRKELGHAATHRHLDMGLDRLAVERHYVAPVGGIDGIDQPGEHVGSDGSAARVAGDELHVHGTGVVGQKDRAGDPPVAQVPEPE